MLSCITRKEVKLLWIWIKCKTSEVSVLKARAHVYISGWVQGVFFRWSTKELANRLGLNGWVRNLADGRVEAVFEGDEIGVEQIIRWCRTGPPGASVSKIEVDWEHPRDEFKGFRIVH